jgi:hypothetical protein
MKKILCSPASYAHWSKRGFLTKTVLVMKLTTIFLVATARQVMAKGTAQMVKYFGKSVTLQKVFSATEQQIRYVNFNDKKNWIS